MSTNASSQSVVHDQICGQQIISKFLVCGAHGYVESACLLTRIINLSLGRR
jgi:hypothetical protein